MSREKNLWLRLGLAIGAGIQDNQLALPHEWDESLQSSAPASTSTSRKSFWLHRGAQTPAYDSQLRVESVAV